MQYDKARQLIRYKIVKYTTGRGIEMTDHYAMFPHFFGMSGNRAIEIVADESINFFVAVMPRELNIAEWWQRLKVGGYFILADVADYTGIIRSLPDWLCLEKENIEDMGFSVYQKGPGDFGQNYWQPIMKKTAAVVRYGGYGDLIQASGIFGILKKQGYHLTVICDQKPAAAIRHDPRIVSGCPRRRPA